MFSDGLHNLSDALSLAIAYWAERSKSRVRRRPPPHAPHAVSTPPHSPNLFSSPTPLVLPPPPPPPPYPAQDHSDSMTYGWKRTELLGGLFNGLFLLSMSVFIFLQAIPSFVSPPEGQALCCRRSSLLLPCHGPVRSCLLAQRRRFSPHHAQT